MSSILTKILLEKYSEDQPRDDHGRWAGESIETRVRDSEKHSSIRNAITKEYDSLVKEQEARYKLNNLEKSAVAKYTFQGYNKMNQDLRRGGFMGKDPNLDSAISNSVISKNIDVYRGATLSAETVSKLTPGITFYDKGYNSTSLIPSNALSFANRGGEGRERVVFLINVPKGSNGLAVGKLSQNPSEKEVLFSRGSRFKVESISSFKLKGHFQGYKGISLSYLGTAK